MVRCYPGSIQFSRMIQNYDIYLQKEKAIGSMVDGHGHCVGLCIASHSPDLSTYIERIEYLVCRIVH